MSFGQKSIGWTSFGQKLIWLMSLVKSQLDYCHLAKSQSLSCSHLTKLPSSQLTVSLLIWQTDGHITGSAKWHFNQLTLPLLPWPNDILTNWHYHYWVRPNDILTDWHYNYSFGQMTFLPTDINVTVLDKWQFNQLILELLVRPNDILTNWHYDFCVQLHSSKWDSTNWLSAKWFSVDKLL